MTIRAHPSALSSLLFLSLIPVVLSLNFNYNPVNQSVASSLISEGNVSFLPSSVQLTFYDANPRSKAGRLYYANPLSLWSASSGQEASFNCSFHFQISTPGINFENQYGDGLAFLLVNSSSVDLPANSTGGWLGLVGPAKNGNASNEIVAVEFDTYQNVNLEDPNANHIGVDVNSVISVQNQSELGFDLKLSSSVYAWIDYSSSDHSLVVYATNVSGSKPGLPLLSYQINLSQLLPETVLVGFSASTGASYEIHTLISWSFNSSAMIGPVSKKHSRGWIVGLVVGLSVLALVVVGGLLALTKFRGGRDSVEEIEFPSLTSGPKKFTYKQLCVATKNFSSTQKLGQGGFGSVYKGVLPENRSEVAVKLTSQKSMQGEKQFRAEVSIISRIRHRNLVELKGWCQENGSLLLVYEYLPNRSLDYYLFGKREDVLEWSTRYRIVCELGSALQYLHEECEKVIIHRDVKASNVMLDGKFTAKLGDFGLARQLGEGVSAHTTMAAGTIGYMAPECYGTGKATTESDVFSYGAVLLEVACGRPPADPTLGREADGLLVNWVWWLYGNGRLLEAVDATLAGNFDELALTRMLIVGLSCSHPDAKSRPSIRLALDSLQGRAPLPVVPPSKPVAYFAPPPPLSVVDLLSATSSVPTLSTFPSSVAESPDHSLLDSVG